MLANWKEKYGIPTPIGMVGMLTEFLGSFALLVAGLATLQFPWSFEFDLADLRKALTFGVPKAGARSRCDIILDLTGGAPLFTAHEMRDGYLRPDPRDPAVIVRREASHFESPDRRPPGRNRPS